MHNVFFEKGNNFYLIQKINFRSIMIFLINKLSSIKINLLSRFLIFSQE